MTQHPWKAILPLIALLALMTACGTVAAPVESQPSPEPSARGATIDLLDAATGDVWQVAVLRPSPIPPGACAEDAAVDTAVMTADLPASRVGYTLLAGSTETDAMRVAECVQQGIESGEITITPPAAD